MPWVQWTTQDELAFVRHKLFEAGKVDALRRYVQLAPYRVWHGPGMNIDPGMVILAAQDMLAALEKAAKPSSNGPVGQA